MSVGSPVVRNWFGSGHDIYLDEFYYISYKDQRLTQEEINKKYPKYVEILRWRGLPHMQFKALAELHPEESPKYIKITGRMLIEWSEKGFVPQFDKYFEKTRRLIMMPIEAYDFYAANSRMLRKRKKSVR